MEEAQSRRFQVHWGWKPEHKGYVVVDVGEQRVPFFKGKVVFNTDSKIDAIDRANNLNAR